MKIYCIKEKFVFVSRRWFSFSLFNFVESFSILWTTFPKMFFPITVMTNFSIHRTFTMVVRIFAKLISVACAEVWLLDFECFEILCRSMVSFDLSISQAYFWVSSVAWPADIWEESIQIHEEDALSKNYHSC